MSLNAKQSSIGKNSALNAIGFSAAVPTSSSLATNTRATCCSPVSRSKPNAKKSGFKFLYDSLAQDDADMLVVREDRNERLYVMREATVETIFRQLGLIK